MEQGGFGGQYETGMSSRGTAALRDFGRLVPVQGQSRRFGDVRATSALPLIADARCEDQQVRKVPTTEVIISVSSGCE
jgi:hypothetical protein